MQKVIILLLLPFILMACTSEPQNLSRTTQKIRLQLKWSHQAQFAGYYIAQEQGFYRDEKLDVSFLEGGKDINQCDRLCSGEADFAVVSFENMMIRHKDALPLKAVAVIYQRNPIVFIAKTESGIIRPHDFRNKTIAIGNLESGGFMEALIQCNALLKLAGIDHKNVKTVPYSIEYDSFLNGAADITPAYLTGGVLKLREQGTRFNVIWPGDYGINFYSDILVTTAAYLDKHPDASLRFVRASLKGWQYAIEHVAEAIDATMKYAKIKDHALQAAMFEAQIPLVHTGQFPVGSMQAKIWQEMQDLLKEQGLLAETQEDISNSFTTDLLHTIYGNKVP